MCGRLRCCLIYEYDQYVEARKLLPKRNKQVVTPIGEGRVVNVSPLRQTVTVEIPETGYREFKIEEIKVLEDGESYQPATSTETPVPAQTQAPAVPLPAPNRPSFQRQHNRGDKRKR
jgi:hypothetical protein